jgi:hypothetical protein
MWRSAVLVLVLGLGVALAVALALAGAWMLYQLLIRPQEIAELSPRDWS